MVKARAHLLILLCLACSTAADAQLSDNRLLPQSFFFGIDKFSSGRFKLNSYELPALDNAEEQRKADDVKRRNCLNCRTEYFAKELAVEIDLKAAATRIEVADGVIWLLSITSPSAHGFQFFYKTFDIPNGATFHLYTPNKEFVQGAFTRRNMHRTRQFATGILPGSVAVLEYFEPKSVAFEGSIVISGVGHLFRPVFEIGEVIRSGEGEGWKQSGTCTVNVKCNSFVVNESKAVAFMTYRNEDYNLIGGGTGFLVTSTNSPEARQPYFLTAGHCLPFNKPTDHYFADHIFYFYYESSTCQNQLANPFWNSRSVQGAYLKTMADHRFHNNQADYALLELQDKPQNSFEVSYLGWDRRQAGQGGTARNISHPMGDGKKVASGSSPIARGRMIYGNCLDAFLQIWQINWTTGVTQPLSSGSPLLNGSGRVIGLLHGGLSRCSDSPEPTGTCSESGALSGPDFFQRLDWAWNHPGEWPYSYQPLSWFLDQNRTGAEVTDIWIPTVAPGTDPGGPSPCRIRRVKDPWSFKLSLEDDNTRKFGWSTSSEGEYLVVGAPGERIVYVYKNEDCRMVRKAELVSDDAFGQFGFSVSISSGQIVVGDPGNGTNPGSIYIFTRSGEVWTKVARWGSGSPQFGWAVALHGNNLVVGSPDEEGKLGMAYFYQKNGGGGWDLNIRNMGEVVDGGFGKSVDIKDSRAVVGAVCPNPAEPTDDGNRIYIYTYQSLYGSMKWTNPVIKGYWVSPDSNLPNYYGQHVKLREDGNEVVVTGGPTVSYRLVNGSWTQQPNIDGPGGDGDISLLGEFLIKSNSTQTKLFRRNASGTYDLINVAPKNYHDTESQDAYGHSVTLTDQIFAVGSPELKPTCTYSGSVYVYDLNYFLAAESLVTCNKTFSATTALTLARSHSLGGEGCSITCQPGSTTTVKASDYVLLKPGFWAKNGSSFTASVVGCASMSNGTNSGGGRIPADEIDQELIAEHGPLGNEAQFSTHESKHDDPWLSVYPNPSVSKRVTVESMVGEISAVQLFNLDGKLVLDVSLEYASEKRVEAYAPDQTQGIFILKATVNGKILIRKIAFK